jgi:hypothetical protein
MFVTTSSPTTPLVARADSFSGRDHDYQALNLSFAVNVVKFGTILSFVPKPFKLWVPLTSARVLFH